MSGGGWTLAGAGVLAVTWLGPLPGLVARSFAAHMLMHMAVVAIAAPLLALGAVRAWPTIRSMPAAVPMFASVAEAVVVWTWHTPGLYRAASSGGAALVLEQGSFLMVGLALWVSALARPDGSPGAGALAGAGALFFTAMHMTMLGVLIALALAPIFPSPIGGVGIFGLSAAADRELGGVLMLAIGGTVYLLGGLGLMAGVLRDTGRAGVSGR